MPAGYFGHVAGVGGRQGGEAKPVHFGLMFTGIKRRRSQRQRVPNEPEGREGRAAVQTKVRAGTPESHASRAKAQTRTTPRSRLSRREPRESSGLFSTSDLPAGLPTAARATCVLDLARGLSPSPCGFGASQKKRGRFFQGRGVQ